MKWTDEKVEQLLDEYEYCDLIELSEKLGCTVKALTRKAEKLRLFTETGLIAYYVLGTGEPERNKMPS